MNGHDGRAAAMPGGDKIGKMKHMGAHQQQFQRQRPALKAMMGRRVERMTQHVGRYNQRTQMVTVLEADNLIVGGAHR